MEKQNAKSHNIASRLGTFCMEIGNSTPIFDAVPYRIAIGRQIPPCEISGQSKNVYRSLNVNLIHSSNFDGMNRACSLEKKCPNDKTDALKYLYTISFLKNSNKTKNNIKIN